jgi:hypothetical protein
LTKVPQQELLNPPDEMCEEEQQFLRVLVFAGTSPVLKTRSNVDNVDNKKMTSNVIHRAHTFIFSTSNPAIFAQLLNCRLTTQLHLKIAV